MKKIALILFLVSVGMVAQRPNHYKVKVFKTAHITQKLNLTSAGAKKFWPIYNAFDNKLMELREKERSKIFRKIKNGGIDALSEKKQIYLSIGC